MDDPAIPSEEAVRARLACAEAALQVQQARLQQLLGALRALPDGIVLVDPQGRITDLNLGAVHLTGWAEAEALGRPLHDVVALHDSHGCNVDLLGPGHDVSGQVASLVRRDGHEVLVDATIAAISEGGQEPSGAVVAFRNVTAAKRISDELTFHATHDPLTGVLNRRAFETHLERAVAHASRHGTPYALLYLDLDRFKAVNDTAGHSAGDELLRVLSVLLQRSLRDHDTLARLGGDEFAVLLGHCEPTEALEIAERIRAAVANFRFRWRDNEFSVGTSIGLVAFCSDAFTPQKLLRCADEACYRAKSGGRNQVQVYQPPRRATPTPRPAPTRRKAASARPPHPKPAPI